MNISQIRQKSIPIFNEYGVTYAGLFGSFSRGHETQKSDIDIMIKLGKPIGMFSYMRFINTLESVLKRKVDIMTEDSMNKHIKPYVMQDMITICEK